jgi:hypothetical protein
MLPGLLTELSTCDAMAQLLQERLVRRLPPPKAVAADLVFIEVHLHTYQPV